MRQYRARERAPDTVDEPTERWPRQAPPEEPLDEPEAHAPYGHSDYASHANADHFHSPPFVVLAVAKLIQVGYYVLGVIEGLLGIRLIFRLLAVNPESPIAQFVYGISEPFVLPFRDLVVNPSVDGMVLELTTVIGMIIYFLIFVAFFQLLRLFITHPKS